MGLRVVLNGQARVYDGLTSGSTIASLITELGLKADRIALEVNGQIVSRAIWGETQLSEGDRLELVHFVGGGTTTG